MRKFVSLALVAAALASCAGADQPDTPTPGVAISDPAPTPIIDPTPTPAPSPTLAPTQPLSPTASPTPAGAAEPIFTASDEQWAGRSIYFLLTDRFANGDPSNDDAGGFASDRSDPRRWHGGDFKGLADNLDYIKGMGFGAIWITPVTLQRSSNAFHGYWQYDPYQIDPHLGTLEELRALVDAAHQRDLLVMIDVVPNHTGDFIPGAAAAPPFDDPSWYHNQGNIKNYGNQLEVEQGDLLGLDDLNQENPAARAELLKWIAWLRQETGLDGLRVDTAKHVAKDFLAEFDAAAETHTMGEVFSPDSGYVAPYSRALDAVIDFPFYEASKKALRGSEPMQNIQRLFQADGQYRNVHTNGTFLDNHDVERFLCTATGGPGKDTRTQLKQALAVLFAVRGIPIVYYGTEQEFKGCKDPANREDLFDALNPESPIYQWIATLNTLRSAHPALQRGASADRFIDAGGWAFQ
ncbi:MAG TPA: alpha-amylase family glycosyl hydrolase, partial [Herpetosiphonaceae bacterium]